jgi:hypothetical protein
MPGYTRSLVDEYQIEIRDIRRQLGLLRAAEAAPELIDEYEAELRNLLELYLAATVTYEQQNPRLAEALDLLGFGDWTLTNVYSFVYECAMDAEEDGRDLANIIGSIDYAASLLAALDA